MRPATDLVRVCNPAIRRLWRLRIIVDGLFMPVDSSTDRAVSFVVIESQNLWVNFNRAFYLSCILRARSLSGKRIELMNAGHVVPGTAIRYAIQQLRPQRSGKKSFHRIDEPQWYNPKVILGLLNSLQSTNFNEVSNAFSYPSQVYDDLIVFRNFFAHRSEETAQRAAILGRKYGVRNGSHPTEIMCTRCRGSPRSLLVEWVDDLKEIIELMGH